MSQSLSNILLHVIFSTKDRKPFIEDAIQSEVYAYMVEILSNHGSFVYQIGGMPDHIHILMQIPRTIAVSSLIEDVKKSTSKWIKTKGQKYLNFSWQKGYGVFSVSASNIDAVDKYIKNQKTHHKKFNFQEELLRFLKLNKIPYNEKYLWS